MSWMHDAADRFRKQYDGDTHTIANPQGVVVGTHKAPSRPVQTGDVYVLTKRIMTLGGEDYEPGDKFEIVKKGVKSPHGWINSLGNSLVKTKNGESVWSSIEMMIGRGELVLEEKE